MKIEFLLRLLLKIFVYGAIFVFVVSGYLFFTSIRPPRFVSPWTPADFGLRYEEVTLRTKDGINLKAWYVPAEGANRAIILCHGYPADKGNIIGLGRILHPAYNLLFFDFRGMGTSGGNVTTVGFREVEDLAAAIDYVQLRGIRKIGVYGFSMGGAVALMAEDPRVRAVVSESAFASLNLIIDDIYKKFGVCKYPFILATKIYARLFLGVDVSGISALQSIARRQIPILLMHSERDSQIPVRHAAMLHRANPATLLWIIPGADHGENLDQQEYRDRITKFFAENL
jgi:pimeloyl-ACP methyl ester carboxylesterase